MTKQEEQELRAVLSAVENYIIAVVRTALDYGAMVPDTTRTVAAASLTGAREDLVGAVRALSNRS